MTAKGVVSVHSESIDGKKILKNIRYWVSFTSPPYMHESYTRDRALPWPLRTDYYTFVHKYFPNNIETGRGEFCA